MHAVQKSIVKSFPPPKSLVSLPRGSFQQHFKNSFQTCSMLRNPRPPPTFTLMGHILFFFLLKYILFHISAYINPSHSVYRLCAIHCMVAQQLMYPLLKTGERLGHS